MKLSDLLESERCELDEDGCGFHFELRDDDDTLYIAYFSEGHFCMDYEIKLDLEEMI